MPLQSQVIPICVTQNSCFSAFFERKCSLTAKPSIFDPIVLHIFRKLSIWGFRKSGWNSIFDILWSVRFLVTGMDWILPSFLHCVLERNPPERIFEIQFRKSSQEDFAQKCFVWLKHFWLRHLNFAGTSLFAAISRLRAGITRTKMSVRPLYIYIFWIVSA